MSGHNKRRNYRVAVKLLTYSALIAIGYIFLSSVFTSNNQDSPTLIINIAELDQGELMVQEWGRRKVLILHRSTDMMDSLLDDDSGLYDSESRLSQQPAITKNRYRSIKPEFFIAIASGTDLNCDIEILPFDHASNTDGWQGGFQDLCRGSKYDYAGRVLKGQQAKRNLIIPEYQFNSENELIISGN